jgi:hypothetical protein
MRGGCRPYSSAVQKTRRIPRAFVDRIVADASAGAQVDIGEYAAAWLAEHTQAAPERRRLQTLARTARVTNFLGQLAEDSATLVITMDKTLRDPGGAGGRDRRVPSGRRSRGS